MFNIIETKKKTCNEKFVNRSQLQLIDFWKWAHSDLIGNAERGILAEYIVSSAFNTDNKCRVEWDAYDILTEDGIKIEVKTSAYLQTWHQDKYSNINFGIRPTKGYDYKTNTYEEEVKRKADIYVFCVHKHKDENTINPLDMNQWEFYVLNTKVLNEKKGNQKTISLKGIIELGAVLCSYDKLNKTVHEELKK